MISSEKTSIWYNATVWLNQRQTAPQIWSNRDSVPMPCVLLRPKRCCMLALRLFLHKEAAARQAQAPLHLRRGNLAHAWRSRSSRATRIDRKVTHGANTNRGWAGAMAHEVVSGFDGGFHVHHPPPYMVVASLLLRQAFVGTMYLLLYQTIYVYSIDRRQRS